MLTIWLAASVNFYPPPIAETTMQASTYGQEFQGHKMANGERFDPEKMVVAHRSLPLGTMILLINPCNDKKVTAIVKDRGPYVRGRHIDLSTGVARKMGLKMGKKGTAPVIVQVLE